MKIDVSLVAFRDSVFRRRLEFELAIGFQYSEPNFPSREQRKDIRILSKALS